MSAHPTSERSLLGSSLVARYELRAVLGRGGMGEVYEAVDRQLNRTVAVKILRPELAADRRFPARFRREARTVAGLSHAGIVAVYDVGEDDGNTFIVMELVAGRTVGDLIGSESPLDPGRVARIGMSAAQALAHAHSRGVVHRDVAPGNLMVTAGDEVKVLDFGIARAARGSARPGSGTTRGTVAYVAPEQLSGHTPDHRADIYGLGAVLYELATGRAPFTGATAEEVAERARTEIPIAPGVLAGVPASLSDAIQRCLAKDPADRPSDAGTLAELLWRAALASPPTGRTAGSRAASTAETMPVPRAMTQVLPSDVTPVPIAEEDPARVTAELGTSAQPRRFGRKVAIAALVSMAIGAALVAVPSIASMGSSVAATPKGPKPLAAPTGLTASASCDGFMATGVDLAWTATGAGEGFEIWRRGGASAKPVLVETITDPGTTTFRDIDLGVDTSYRYRVKAIDGPRVSRPSREAVAATPFLCLS
ncbi:MAG TPA: protein kinase [Actinomycetota bacterium]|jgi:serine/threonine-protein kinase|nr:protein kinase [Actinomycetota bacterium]